MRAIRFRRPHPLPGATSVRALASFRFVATVFTATPEGGASFEAFAAALEPMDGHSPPQPKHRRRRGVNGAVSGSLRTQNAPRATMVGGPSKVRTSAPVTKPNPVPAKPAFDKKQVAIGVGRRTFLVFRAGCLAAPLINP